jgi:hypothetical protein
MKRTPLRMLAAGAGAAVIATAIASPVRSSASSTPGTETITFQEPNGIIEVNDIPPLSKNGSKLSVGDRITTSFGLYNDNHDRQGLGAGTCTAVAPGKTFITTPVLCDAVYHTTQGDIIATGIVTLGKTDLTITGGSGAYAGVHGFIVAGVTEKGYFDADKLTIER